MNPQLRRYIADTGPASLTFFASVIGAMLLAKRVEPRRSSCAPAFAIGAAFSEVHPIRNSGGELHRAQLCIKQEHSRGMT